MLHLRNELQNDEGFTLIELLVVILIIGILAAIAIPSFLNQRYKGQDACAKSMAKQMQTAAETYQTDNNNYSGLGITSLNAIETTITDVTPASGGCRALAVGGTVTAGACGGSSTATAYCVSAVSANGNSFVLANSGGAVSRTCLVPGTNNRGGCPTTGRW
jgi:type IV pilus assembly protein PilA